MSHDWKALAAPFAAEAIEWRIGQVAKSGNSATVLAYLTSRAVMDRLDDVVGPENWSDDYHDLPNGGVQCTIKVRCGDEWVSKTDAADPTQIEATKGGRSDAFKRAAVKWGIGRYLYRIPEYRMRVTEGYAPNGKPSIKASWSGQGGRKYGWCDVPSLPAWALPATEGKVEQRERRQAHDLDWENGGRERFFAAVSDIDGPGVSYDQIKAWCAAHNRPKPSQMSRTQRDAMLDWLRGGGLAAVLDWHAAQGAA